MFGSTKKKEEEKEKPNIIEEVKAINSHADTLRREHNENIARAEKLLSVPLVKTGTNTPFSIDEFLKKHNLNQKPLEPVKKQRLDVAETQKSDAMKPIEFVPPSLPPDSSKVPTPLIVAEEEIFFPEDLIQELFRGGNETKPSVAPKANNDVLDKKYKECKSILGNYIRNLRDDVNRLCGLFADPVCVDYLCTNVEIGNSKTIVQQSKVLDLFFSILNLTAFPPSGFKDKLIDVLIQMWEHKDQVVASYFLDSKNSYWLYKKRKLEDSYIKLLRLFYPDVSNINKLLITMPSDFLKIILKTMSSNAFTGDIAKMYDFLKAELKKVIDAKSAEKEQVLQDNSTFNYQPWQRPRS